MLDGDPIHLRKCQNRLRTFIELQIEPIVSDTHIRDVSTYNYISAPGRLYGVELSKENRAPAPCEIHSLRCVRGLYMTLCPHSLHLTGSLSERVEATPQSRVSRCSLANKQGQ